MRGRNFINMSLANCGLHFCFASQNSSWTVGMSTNKAGEFEKLGEHRLHKLLETANLHTKTNNFPTYELNSYSKFLLMNSLKAALFPISVISDLKLGQARRRCPQNVCRLKQQAAIYNLLFARFWYGNNAALWINILTKFPIIPKNFVDFIFRAMC